MIINLPISVAIFFYVIPKDDVRLAIDPFFIISYKQMKRTQRGWTYLSRYLVINLSFSNHVGSPKGRKVFVL